MEAGTAINQQVPNVTASPEYIAAHHVDVAGDCEADMHEASAEQQDESAPFALSTNLPLDERDGPAVMPDPAVKVGISASTQRNAMLYNSCFNGFKETHRAQR